MTHAIRLEQVTSQPIAVVRRHAARHELSKVIPEACGTVWTALKALQTKGAGRHVAVYRACSNDLFDLEIGAEVEAPFTQHGEVFGSATPAGLAATLIHFGPYQKLAQAHQAIHQWVAANNRILAGPSCEVYGHWLSEWNSDPSKIRTDIFYLLKP